MYKKEKVKGYEEYQVDTNGIVYSKKGNPLKYSLNYRGYCIVNFITNGKRKGFGIHTLVAKQFIPNNDLSKTQVNHKDGNKRNNSVENLEWLTPLENTHHSIYVLGNDFSGRKHYNAVKVAAFDAYGNIKYKFDSLIEAGKFFCKEKENPRYKMNCIWKALNGRNKTYKKLIWKYL